MLEWIYATPFESLDVERNPQITNIKTSCLVFTLNPWPLQTLTISLPLPLEQAMTWFINQTIWFINQMPARHPPTSSWCKQTLLSTVHAHYRASNGCRQTDTDTQTDTVRHTLTDTLTQTQTPKQCIPVWQMMLVVNMLSGVSVPEVRGRLRPPCRRPSRCPRDWTCSQARWRMQRASWKP